MIVPTAIVWRGDTPLMTMAKIAGDRLCQPFWADTLVGARTIGFEPLDDFMPATPALGVAGMIFHIGRCGSTLLCRQFEALPRTVALSEPFVFQQLLDGPVSPADVTRRRVRRLLAAHWQGLRGACDRLIVKWPALLSQHARAIMEALPEVPALFLHRDPRMVLVAVADDPIAANGAVCPRHLALSPSSAPTAMPSDPLEISARLIAAAYAGAIDAPGLRTVDYADLPSAAWQMIAGHFGIALSPSDADAMLRVAGYHSKDPARTRRFVPDSERKAAAASGRIDDLVERIIAPVAARMSERLSPLDRG